MKRIPRRVQLNAHTFVDEFIIENRPVVIRDAMVDWPALSAWRPSYFERKFGEVPVQIYDQGFTLIDIDTLGAYLARNFGRGPEFVAEEYVRAYAKFKEIDASWADEIFSELSRDWDHPYFFPSSAFALPACGTDASISPVFDPFPYKGLFLSGRGARTRLHRDPYGSDAILCQFYGDKRLLVYEPRHADRLMSEGVPIDPQRFNECGSPSIRSPDPDFDDVLIPGECLFIPGGWLHDVITVSDSISITWNFVHGSSVARFERERSNVMNTRDREMLDYLSTPRGRPRDVGSIDRVMVAGAASTLDSPTVAAKVACNVR